MSDPLALGFGIIDVEELVDIGLLCNRFFVGTLAKFQNAVGFDFLENNFTTFGFIFILDFFFLGFSHHARLGKIVRKFYKNNFSKNTRKSVFKFNHQKNN